jgi:hypothetical protein
LTGFFHYWTGMRIRACSLVSLTALPLTSLM